MALSEPLEIVVIGGGIAGVSVAAHLARGGARVTVVERTTLAAEASGRNSGSLQRPFDRVLGPLHDRTMQLYRQLADEDPAFDLPAAPAGLLLLAEAPDSLPAEVGATVAGTSGPDQLLDPDAVRRLEPALGDGLWGTVVPTGYPVVPASATLAYARRARASGAGIMVGEEAIALDGDGRVEGLRLASGRRLRADVVVVAAGPWTPTLVPAWSRAPPITPVWGVVAGLRLDEPPRHILEEVGIDSTGSAMSAFSLVTAAGISAVGSTFLRRRPDPVALAPELIRRGARFVPGLAEARLAEVRACPRPVSIDGRPLVGAVPGIAGLYVCSGHGPWGMSIGPATAELVADEILGRGDRTPADLSVSRLVTPSDTQAGTTDVETPTRDARSTSTRGLRGAPRSSERSA